MEIPNPHCVSKPAIWLSQLHRYIALSSISACSARRKRATEGDVYLIRLVSSGDFNTAIQMEAKVKLD